MVEKFVVVIASKLLCAHFLYAKIGGLALYPDLDVVLAQMSFARRRTKNMSINRNTTNKKNINYNTH